MKSYKIRLLPGIFLTASIIMFIGATQPRAALDRVALVGATLINGTGGTPVTDATILIEDTKIIAVGRRSTIQIPDGVRIIDLTGKWVLPGFVDLHMHLTYTHDERLDALQTNSEATVRAVYYMNMFLRNGITSVRDVAAPIEPMQAIVRGIQNRS